MWMMMDDDLGWIIWMDRIDSGGWRLQEILPWEIFEALPLLSVD